MLREVHPGSRRNGWSGGVERHAVAPEAGQRVPHPQGFGEIQTQLGIGPVDLLVVVQPTGKFRLEIGKLGVSVRDVRSFSSTSASLNRPIELICVSSYGRSCKSTGSYSRTGSAD